MTGRASADTNLAEIHEEMSELLDKQVNVQKESLKKNFWGSCELPQAHKKVCDENERNKEEKTTAASKKFLWKEGFIRPYQKTG